ncbi:hypothetical protein DXA67_02550 [Bacteroides fragilis]|nr:hypothetical protein DXB57_01600 [Bacteroides fragilis]RGX89889.1 hypothetical protein DXA67_02550 [Bacteroides fragilis]
MFRHLHNQRSTRKKSLSFHLSNGNNIWNERKHIEIFQKEVSIFSSCLRLSDQMLTSFSGNTGSFGWKQSVFSRCANIVQTY